MRIGIIGTGAIGSILAERFSQAGHHVKVTNTRAMPELEKIAASLGATAATIHDVVKDVDAIIFSMPFGAYKDLPKDLLKAVPQDVVVMDTSNYYPFRDGEIAELEQISETEYISGILNRPLVKVFNNILEHTLKYKGKTAGAEGRIAISIAGDNEEHKKVVAQLVDITGFDTVDAGSLAESWRQQPGTPAYCTELNEAELKKALADAEKGKAPAIRDFIMDDLRRKPTWPSYEEILAGNRRIQMGRNQNQ
ncbi:NADPH-dependent F420 reductase [Rufibacter glacialis]|uniref:3-hydroxyisobutyrate dehydrogenase n=1 Tax=Rufibacter glacialis TaxID=1259555 RepID=A0A5M8QJ20_9BACT|nr:NAD(P)-binding domain-containing protein [Rufibacter glacialis]KAA6434753.1 3-hydroxyisobutyrate dehydrogenase [Rufibacter glacialis]GGK72143.1 3-hydroxyisobutyrate dehydrogenase [Rufibacter glacialis]